jgi:hypothetical protein
VSHCPDCGCETEGFWACPACYDKRLENLRERCPETHQVTASDDPNVLNLPAGRDIERNVNTRWHEARTYGQKVKLGHTTGG